MLIKFLHKVCSYVMYGDNNRSNILGECIMGNPSTITVHVVFFVKGLKHNILRINRLWEKGHSIIFYTLGCLIEHKTDKKSMFKGYRVDNVYVMYLDNVLKGGTKCLVTRSEYSWLWHRSLGHAHFDLINKIWYKNLVIHLRDTEFSKEKLCDACQIGKQAIMSFKSK